MIQEQTKSKTIQVNGVPVTCHSDGSTTRINPSTGEPRRIFGFKTDKGYPCRQIKKKRIRVHEMIARAFLGEKPEGYSVDHINGVKSDNRLENLRYVNHSQNLRGARKINGNSKYRGVHLTKDDRFEVRVLGKYQGRFLDEQEAAECFDDVAFYEHNFPLEGLNFPQRILDKMAEDDTNNKMNNTPENIERLQTQIEMIRQESRILSYRIERMMEQRKGLSEEKRKLKEKLESLSV